MSETGCQRIRFELRQARTYQGETEAEKIRDELLPYDFFERVLLGENYAELLSDGLRTKANGIVGFLGDFQAVSLTPDPFTCGLIREKSPNLYEVHYFTAKVEQGKIADITAG